MSKVKTNRMAYVVVVSSRLDSMVQQVHVFTNLHAAEMCKRQFTPRRRNGVACLFVRNMNDGRVSLEGHHGEETEVPVGEVRRS